MSIQEIPVDWQVHAVLALWVDPYAGRFRRYLISLVSHSPNQLKSGIRTC
jgi:hypothetical protein